MAKIEAYKFINPGMATDNASEGSLVGRKLVLGYNRIGKTLTGMGNVIKDIENIELARIKNDALEDKLERRQAQRERDQEAEELTERKALEKGDTGKKSKSKIKGFFGRSKIGKGLMSMLPAWAQALEPIFRLFVNILKITVIKEMLEWMSKPENKEKLETFFHKANVIFTKLSQFGNWLINDKLLGGIEKLFGKEKTLGERFSGLWDLTQGIAVLAALTNPVGMLVAIVGWIGNFINKFNLFKKKPKVPGDKNQSKNSKNKQRTKSKGSSKGVKGKTSFTNKGKFKSTQFRAPVVEGSKNILKKGNWWQKTWSGMKNWGKKGVKNFKTKPLATTGSVLKGAGNTVKGLGVGFALDWSINEIADVLINDPLERAANKKRESKVSEKFLELGSDGVVKYYEDLLNKEQSKEKTWGLFGGPSKPKVADLAYKLDYARRITTNRDIYALFKPK